MNLPEQYMQNMQKLLGDEYQAYDTSFSMPAYRGLRPNLLRENAEEKCAALSFSEEKIPFVRHGYYIPQDAKPALHPYYAGGLYYLQEPSAMLPADRMPVEKGDLVLDLCAAPGGKATELLAKLNGSGLLLANDISASRAKALVKSLVMAGGRNFFVSVMDPIALSSIYGPVFDKILLDAPCSGEGMFRRDPSLVKDWMQKGPSYYAPIQKQLLEAAFCLLKDGGYLMYSTCTFSTLENEENILSFLKDHPQMHPVKIECSDGMTEGFLGLSQAARCFPHKMKGEGHFLALLKKDDTGHNVSSGNMSMRSDDKGKIPESLSAFLQKIKADIEPSQIVIRNNCVYYLPFGYEKLYRDSIRFLRTGILMGELDKRGGFRPDQALAMCCGKNDFDPVLNLSAQDERVLRYLRGESVFLKDHEQIAKGDVLLFVDGIPLGFAKAEGGRLKNRLQPGFIMN